MRAVVGALARARQSRAGRAYGSLLRIVEAACPRRIALRSAHEAAHGLRLEKELDHLADEPLHQGVAPLIPRLSVDFAFHVDQIDVARVRVAAASQLESAAAAPGNDGETRRLPHSACRRSRSWSARSEFGFGGWPSGVGNLPNSSLCRSPVSDVETRRVASKAAGQVPFVSCRVAPNPIAERERERGKPGLKKIKTPPRRRD